MTSETEEKVANGQAKAMPKSKKTSVSWLSREDIWVFVFGIAFLLMYITLMYTIGEARGWDAPSGYTHNTSATSRDRFLPEPFEPEEGVFGRYGKDATSRWYYWKLPPWQVTFWTRMFPWVGYVLHQLTIWATIYYAQQVKAREPLGDGRYSASLRNFNWAALGLNVLFHLLHFVNTHTTYDGTAQDTPVSTSQSSVVMLLMLILIMEYRDRGIAFGWPVPSDTGAISSTLRLDPTPSNIVRKYHGYAFAWACVYTFWFHPMENTLGHALGLAYTYIILLQGALMYTNIHVSKALRLFNESWVMVHGGLVASQTGGPAQMGAKLWPIFVFGPGMIFLGSHIFLLSFWKRLPRWVRYLPALTFLYVCNWAYSWIPDADGNPTRFKEVIRMPAFHLMCFLYGYGLLRLFLFIERLVKGPPSTAPSPPPSPLKQTIYLMGVLMIYAFHVGLAVYVHYSDPHMNLILMMNYFVMVYILGVMISFMLLKQIVPAKIVDDAAMVTVANGNTEVTKGGTTVDELGKVIKAE